MKNLSETTRRLIDKLRPKTSDNPGGPNPVFAERKIKDHRWLQRRFFLAYGSSVSIVWVDDDGTCPNQHVDGHSIWHQYEDDRNNVSALRCPEKLAPDLKVRLEADIPPGRAWSRLAEARAGRQGTKSTKAGYDVE